MKPDSYPDLPTGVSYVDRIAILDTVTKNITLFCIPGASNVSPVIWSPDGTQLLINTLSGDSYDTVLVDTVKGFAAKISENTIPQGWVLNKP